MFPFTEVLSSGTGNAVIRYEGPAPSPGLSSLSDETKIEVLGQFAAMRITEAGSMGIKVYGKRCGAVHLDSNSYRQLRGSSSLLLYFFQNPARINTEAKFIIDGEDMLLIGYDELARWAFADRKDRAGCADHAYFASLLKNLGVKSPWVLFDKPSDLSSRNKVVKAEELETDDDADAADDRMSLHEQKTSVGGSKIECVDLLDSDSEHEGAQLKVLTPGKSGKPGKPSASYPGMPTVSKSSTPEMLFG